MKLQMEIVDAFSEAPFTGNPAAVIILEQWLSDHLMQNIAAQNNLSETAFVVKEGGVHHIRWFSPLSEIDFCGHASLASAHVLFTRSAGRQEIQFYADAVGEFDVSRLEDGKIQMRFPNRAPNEIEEIPEPLLAGLSITPVKVLHSPQAYFAIYDDPQDVLDLQTNSGLLAQLAPYDVVVTAPAEELRDADFISRYFWPANGGDEDPVTGSIHAGLVPYWAEQLQCSQLIAEQVSPRSGRLYCELTSDRVLIAGYARSYLKGDIEV